MAIPSSYPMIPKLAVVILLALPQAGVSEELATTQGLLPEGLTESRDYEVWVDGRRQQVLETRKTTNHGTHNIERMSFVGFDADAETQVQLKVQRPFRTYEVRPRRTDFRLSRDGHVLTLSLQPGQQATVLFDGGYDHALIIAANPRQIAPQPSDVQHFFAPGVHRLAKRLPLRSGDRVYLAEGAIVCGAFDLRQVEDVHIFGRGIVYGGETPHQENYRVFAGDDTRNVTIEGITICNAPGWIISFWSGSEHLTVRNVKMLGNFRYNTDGVQTGTTGLLVENCYLQCNDDNFSLNGICRDVVIRNNVLWNLYNGGVFMLGWATGTHFHLENLRIHDNTIIRCGGCCDYDRKSPFSMKLFGSQRTARDIEFRNIHVEDIAAFGRWIDLQANKATDSEVRDLRFHDIEIDTTWLVEGEIRGNPQGVLMTDVHFEHVRIGGTPLDRPEAGRLNLIHTRGTTINGETFADVTWPPQPIPEQAAPRASKPSTALPRPARSPEKAATGRNLLENGDFQAGKRGWQFPAPKQGAAKLVSLAKDTPAVLISGRTSSAVGITYDVTDILRAHGAGTYSYGVIAKGVREPLHMKATLEIEDERGVQRHPSPDALVDTKSFSTASRAQNLKWSQLKRATLRIESGHGDRHDMLVREVFLQR